ncbi:MAG: type II toxin-antitoxin system HicB family antitoxin [Sulfuricellaceae bacterium]|nr:type II toxin-antitoxin system HicB family antitoxin [Sulfuricellaceae bacterium]
MNILYPAFFEPQEPSGFFVRFVDIENAITQGETIEECKFNGAEVLSLMIEDRLERGETVPPPSQNIEGAHYIAPGPAVQSCLLLRMARGDRPLSDLARAMETSWAAAQRLENPRHWPSLKQLDKAAKVLGKRLVLSLE